jgi:hypothetical protein
MKTRLSWHPLIDDKCLWIFVKFDGGLFTLFARKLRFKKKWDFFRGGLCSLHSEKICPHLSTVYTLKSAVCQWRHPGFTDWGKNQFVKTLPFGKRTDHHHLGKSARFLGCQMSWERDIQPAFKFNKLRDVSFFYRLITRKPDFLGLTAVFYTTPNQSLFGDFF